MLVGLSGYARSGKDTVGAFLVEDLQFTRFAFADTMKAAAAALDPVIDWYVTPGRGGRPIYLHEVLDASGGWEAAKEIPEVRRLLQRLGTEVGRNTFGADFWVDRTFEQIGDTEKVVITDVRFVNEADAIRARGGVVVRVNRPGVTAPNDHPSEHALAEYSFDRHIFNDGTLEQLRERALDLTWVAA